MPFNEQTSAYHILGISLILTDQYMGLSGFAVAVARIGRFHSMFRFHRSLAPPILVFPRFRMPSIGIYTCSSLLVLSLYSNKTCKGSVTFINNSLTQKPNHKQSPDSYYIPMNAPTLLRFKMMPL